MRPVRLYQHIFTHQGGTRFECARAGRTPCQAKAKAFTALEEELKLQTAWPRGGWRLLEQKDITHVLYQRRTI